MSEDKVVVNIKVIPNSPSFQILEGADRNTLRVRVKSKAMKGKANAELLKELRRTLKDDVEIVSGEKSRDKKISVSKKGLELLSCLADKAP